MSSTSAAFWDRIAPKYNKQAIADEDSYQRKLRQTQALMHPGMNIIEFGCGTGSTALKHAEHVQHVVATDVSAGMLAIGQEKADKAGVRNIEFRQSSAEGFDGEAGSYDIVLALNLLHLLSDRQNALETFARLLKPGGYLVTSTVCLADKKWFLLPLIKVMQWIGKAPYVSFVSPELVQKEIASLGFDCEESWTHGSAKSLFLIAKKR